MLLKSKPLLLFLCCLAAPAVMATEATVSDEMFRVNNVWMMVAAFLVFIMHLGFACLEAGMTQSKNTVNILFKNTMILCIGILTYAFVGFNLMYPGEAYAGGWFGFSHFGLSSDPVGQTSAYNAGYTYNTDFLFQAMFAATAATIVSGAVAERIKLGPFLVFSTLYVAICYPVVGMWKWGGGWLAALGFHDFAGSTIVHAVGGWAALIGALILGPRLGKYVGGQVITINGHNLPLATIGTFLLWLGWFGFNGGSVLSADPASVSHVLVTTNLAAAAGVMGAFLVTHISDVKHYDLGMVLNGSLAGLVSITAGADVVTPNEALFIGLIGGGLVVASIRLLDRIGIDDPVSAISVHLSCGIWGTLAVGLFGNADPAVLGYAISFQSQLIGVLATAAFCAITSFALFFGIHKLAGMRVSPEHETGGLDHYEHGVEAYASLPVTPPN